MNSRPAEQINALLINAARPVCPQNVRQLCVRSPATVASIDSMNEMHFPLTRRANSIWIAAVITLVLGAIGSIPIRRHYEMQRIDAIRADIRLIDSAATQIASR
jgi:hypothetical protein